MVMRDCRSSLEIRGATIGLQTGREITTFDVVYILHRRPNRNQDTTRFTETTRARLGLMGNLSMQYIYCMDS